MDSRVLAAMKPRRRRSLGLALAALLATFDLCPRANATDSSAAAQALFDEAKAQMAKGRYDKACPALEESQKLDPALGTILNLADCYEKAGRTASAWSKFLEAAAKAQKSGHKDVEKIAKDRAQALEKKLAKLTITVSSAEAQPGLELTRDGVAVGPAELGLAIPVDPGAHTIAARAPGRKPWETRIDVAAASAASTLVPLLEKEPEAAPAPVAAAATPAEPAQPSQEPAAPAASSKSSSSRKTIGLIVGGVGIAAAATGGVFAALAKSKDKAGDELCHANGSDNQCANPEEKREYEDTVSDAKRNRTIAIVGFSVGGAALAAGAILFFGGSSSSSQTAVNVAPAAGPGEAGLVAWGRF
ncbi:MAG TPA: hypothetical protein VNN72_14145 [Polyangiaceae bacterium]|nr:hypothetical protein [Polyangiaceae bacterium]